MTLLTPQGARRGAYPRGPREGPDAGGWWLVGLYTLMWGGTLVVINVLVIVVLLGSMLIGAFAGGDPAASLQAFASELEAGGDVVLPSWLFSLMMPLQFLAMFGLVYAATGVVDRAWYARRPHLARDWDPRRVFALHRASPLVVVLAVGVGLTVGWLPGWIGHVLRELAPWLELGSLDAIEDMLTTGAWPVRAINAVSVVLGAGVVEELVFRGFAWDAIRRAAPPWVTWMLTSLLFAAYHMDPMHVLALMPTAFALGWVRWTTGSILPCIVLHAVNNGFATWAVTSGVDTSAIEGELLPALGMFGVSVSLLGMMWALRVFAGADLGSDEPVPGSAG